MVRLKERQLHVLSRNILFQFHYGTIKSVLRFSSIRFVLLFQFHYGTIKSQHQIEINRTFQSFNSTMVRLKVSYSSIHYSFHMFQFHYGTIKRQKGAFTIRIPALFQFHYGTIKRKQGE